jgi:hypothetical protein
MAVRRACQGGDQPGWTSTNDYQFIIATGGVLLVRWVALVDRALVICIGWE